MVQSARKQADPEGWDWFESEAASEPLVHIDDLVRSFVRCFSGSEGDIVLRHLHQTILDRRLGPKASDAELRFVEGQRSVVAHIISMIDRGRS